MDWSSTGSGSFLLTPNGDGHDDTAGISFRIKGPDRVNLDLLDSSGDVTRHLLVGHPMRDHKFEHFVWDGLADGGTPAPDGVYKLKIEKIERGRTITPPGEGILLIRGQCPPGAERMSTALEVIGGIAGTACAATALLGGDRRLRLAAMLPALALAGLLVIGEASTTS